MQHRWVSVVVLCGVTAWMLGVTTPPAELNKDASHPEGTPLAVKGQTKCKRLTGLAVLGNGNLLACDYAGEVIKVISPDDRLVGTWKLTFRPTVVVVSGNSIYVGGEDALAKLDQNGREVKRALIGETGLPTGHTAGLAVDGEDLYASYARIAGSSGGAIVRTNKDFADPKTIVTGLRGCCGNMDIAARDGVVWAAENAGHRVRGFDRDGKETATWGKSDRVNVEGFGGCCNPMNLFFGSDGTLYTGESEPQRIKKYDTTGKYLGLVGYVGLGEVLHERCTTSRLAVSADGSKVYVADEVNSFIHVLERKTK